MLLNIKDFNNLNYNLAKQTKHWIYSFDIELKNNICTASFEKYNFLLREPIITSKLFTICVKATKVTTHLFRKSFLESKRRY